jgi:hypothetical protein
VLYPISQSQPFQPAVFEAQRRYEALVFLTQGYVPNAGPAPLGDQFDIEQPDENGNVRVIDQFPYAPSVGYLDQASVDLTVDFDDRQFSGRAKLPSAGVDKKGGRLRLVWPNGKELTATELVRPAKRNQTRTFRLLESEAPHNTMLPVVFIEEEPLEVWIGNREIPDSKIKWENNLLAIRIPHDVEPAPVIVITSVRTWVSDTHFRATGLPTRDL